MSILQSVVSKYKDYEQKRANKNKFKDVLLQYTSRGKITPEEIEELNREKSELALTDNDINGFREEAYLNAYSEVSKKGSITKEEENDLQNIQTYLRIPDEAIPQTKTELAHYRFLNDIQLGYIQPIPVSNVILHKDEQAFWSEPASLVEEKIINKSYQGGSRGVSVRIMKGVSYRVGAYKGHIVTQKGNVVVSNGNFLITNQRVIFSGDRKSFAISLKNIINIQPYSNGLFISESGKNTPRILKYSQEGNNDIIGAILSYSINHFKE